MPSVVLREREKERAHRELLMKGTKLNIRSRRYLYLLSSFHSSTKDCFIPPILVIEMVRRVKRIEHRQDEKMRR